MLNKSYKLKLKWQQKVYLLNINVFYVIKLNAEMKQITF